MAARPPVKLSALRDIGWKEWDPIGLAGAEGGWKGSDVADEYDDYRIEVVGRIRNGEPMESVADYLTWIETEHMGLSVTSTTRPRAEATVAGIQQYLRMLA